MKRGSTSSRGTQMTLRDMLARRGVPTASVDTETPKVAIQDQALTNFDNGPNQATEQEEDVTPLPKTEIHVIIDGEESMGSMEQSVLSPIDQPMEASAATPVLLDRQRFTIRIPPMKGLNAKVFPIFDKKAQGHESGPFDPSATDVCDEISFDPSGSRPNPQRRNPPRTSRPSTQVAGVLEDTDALEEDLYMGGRPPDPQEFCPETSGSQSTLKRRNPPRKSRPVLQTDPGAASADIELTTSTRVECSSETPSSPILLSITAPTDVDSIPVRLKSLDLNTGSQEDPITIDASPVKPPAAVASFFAPRKRVPKPPDFSISNSPTPKQGSAIPITFPSAQSQHVRGPQTKFLAPSLSFSRSTPDRTRPTHPESLSTSGVCPENVIGETNQTFFHVQPVYSDEQRVSHLSDIPTSHCERYPAIGRIFSQGNISKPASTGTSQEVWNDKWRPRRANEVLGNEASTEYLKAWLLALAVQVRSPAPSVEVEPSNISHKGGTRKRKFATTESKGKRPTIIRSVKRQKGRPARRTRLDDSDSDTIFDFIVSDTEGPEEEDRNEVAMEQLGSAEGNIQDILRSPKPNLTRLARGRPSEPANENVGADHSSPFPVHLTSTPHDFAFYLSNTILLTGPTGSGKSAAVYACAHELGWEVFEVNPGVGKRSGAGLRALVGDVGKNHIVGRAPTRSITSVGPGSNVRQIALDSEKKSSGLEDRAHQPSSKQAFASLFSESKRKSGSSKPPKSDDGTETATAEPESEYGRPPTESSSSHVSGFDLVAPEQDFVSSLNRGDAVSSSIPATPRQSIILLEEVDILFSEDVHFWPTVVNLIKESRRPVIMTCTDPSLIPQFELPLQTILTFHPCPSSVATSYLQSLALKEGFLVSRDDLLALYESTHDVLAADLGDFASTNSSQPLPEPDLRRAINNLQFLCQTLPENHKVTSTSIVTNVKVPGEIQGRMGDEGSSDRSSSMHPGYSGSDFLESKLDLRNLDSLELFADSVSYVDAYLDRRPLALLEAFAVDNCDPSQDDEMGYKVLNNPVTSDDAHGGIPLFNRDECIAREVLTSASRLVAKASNDLSNDCIRRLEQTEKACSLFNARSRFWTQFNGVMQSVVHEAVLVQSKSRIVLDYGPFVRTVVAADDAQETEMSKIKAISSGRPTRNSQRQGHVRWLDLNEAQRGVLRDTAFRVDDTLRMEEVDRK